MWRGEGPCEPGAVVVGSAPVAPTAAQLLGGTRGSLGTWGPCAAVSVPSCGAVRPAEGVLGGGLWGMCAGGGRGCAAAGR